MNRITCTIVQLFVLPAVIAAAATETRDAELVKVRETVWRAWFANDTKLLHELIPSDTVVISAGEAKWKNQAEELQAAADFQAAGGKLIRLESPAPRYSTSATWPSSGANTGSKPFCRNVQES